jgi:predicted dinucleotide-binding enzyme
MRQGHIAVIGAGKVGDTLATAWERAGRTVAVGVRHPADASRPATTVTEALDGADVVVLAVPGAATRSTIDINAPALAGKVVVDTTNDLSHGPTSVLSALAHLGAVVPDALGYRAFNSIGWENMANPRFGDETADLCFAGPDGAGRTTVESLITDVGFRPVYVGAGDDAHHAVDALATLWFALAFGQDRGRRLAFRVLEDDAD